MAEAKAGEQDQSMEEILQSIKRIIAEEGDTGAPSNAPPDNVPPPSPGAAPFGSDVLELTDMVEEKPIDPIDAIMAMTPAEPPPPPPPSPSIPAGPSAQAAAPKLDTDKIMSDVAVAASASALRSLASSAPAETYAPTSSGATFRSGNTVEDLVLESLRPMLKEWLDANLPQIVERKVQREIERIAASSR